MALERNSEIERFTAAMVALTEVFGRPLGSLPSLYREALSDLKIEAIEGAVKAAIKRCKFMPAPADLRELAPRKGLGIKVFE